MRVDLCRRRNDFMRPAPFAVLASLLSCAYLAPGQDRTEMRSGYVSAISSPTEFDLNGEHILCDAKTQFASPFGIGPVATPCAGHIYIGEPLAIVNFSRKHGVLHAEILNVNNMPTSMKVSGFGILDLPVASDTSPTQGILYADGRRLRLNKDSQLQFTDPLKSLADVRPGAWVTYEGRPEIDGSLTVYTLTLAPNTITEREAKLLKHTSARVVPPDYAAKKVGDVYFGTSKHAWAHIIADQALQERVQTIGAKLIPAWQRDLPDSDPQRIHFQFFVVTRKPVSNDAFSFPDGTILIPEKIVKDVSNEPQLAAILAANIAEVLEKQVARYLPGKEAVGATNLAALGAGFAPVPGLGLGMNLGSAIAASEMQRRENQQADRVSLRLLHDAGYDANQSFLARNAVAHKGKSDVIPYTNRAQNLLANIGNWNAATVIHAD